jgi:hypothetical protein
MIRMALWTYTTLTDSAQHGRDDNAWHHECRPEETRFRSGVWNGISRSGTESPNGPVDAKHRESHTGHPGSNARPPSAPEKTAPDNHESHNGRPVRERGDCVGIAKHGLCDHLPRNHAKAQKRPPCQGGASRNAKSGGCAPELAYLVGGAFEPLIVHLHAFLTRAARLRIPATRLVPLSTASHWVLGRLAVGLKKREAMMDPKVRVPHKHAPR